MSRTRIKICGICRPEDAVAAARAGADAIGLIFHPAAARYVDPARAREIVAALPAFVSPVGVFVDASTEVILRTTREVGLRHVQLHGTETPEQVAELSGLAVVKAVHVKRDRFGQTLDRWREAVRTLGLENLKGLVVDAPAVGESGGTGVANDWETVRRHHAAGDFDGLPPLIAAGGLRPETVGAVVRDLRPWAVDVSSGVEEARGRKSMEKTVRFVEAVREADKL